MLGQFRNLLPVRVQNSTKNQPFVRFGWGKNRRVPNWTGYKPDFKMDFSRDVRRHFLLFFVIFTTKKVQHLEPRISGDGQFLKVISTLCVLPSGPNSLREASSKYLDTILYSRHSDQLFSNSHNSETAGPIFLILKKSLFSFGQRIQRRQLHRSTTPSFEAIRDLSIFAPQF